MQIILMNSLNIFINTMCATLYECVIEIQVRFLLFMENKGADTVHSDRLFLRIAADV